MTTTTLIRPVYRLLLPMLSVCASVSVMATENKAKARIEGNEAKAVIALFTETDTTYYTNFASALKVANKKDNATMQLLADVGFEGSAAAQTIKTNMTIDLNGYSLGDTLSGTSLLLLKTDSLTLRVTSSRPGGRIWAARAYNGKFSVFNITKGALEVSHVRIEAHNTLPYNTASAKSVAASGVTMAAPTSLTINDCRLVCEADKSAVAISGAGNAGAAAKINIRNSTIVSRGMTSVYGVNVYSKARIEDSRIEVEATGSTVYGVNINNYRDTVQGIDYEAQIKNVQVQVQGGTTKVYGVYAKAGIHLENDSIDVHAGTTLAYGLHSDKNLQAEGCVINVKADSTSAEGVSVAAVSQAKIAHCTITAEAPKGKATGFLAAGNAGAAADVLFTGNEVRVQGVSTVYGVNVYSKAQIEDSRIEVEATGSTVYGVNINNYRDTVQGIDYEAQIRNVQVQVQGGTTKVYGVYAKSSLYGERNTITLESNGNTIGGIYCANGTTLLLQNSRVRVKGNTTVYGVSGAGQADITDSRIEVHAFDKAYGINQTAAVVLTRDTVTAHSDATTVYGANCPQGVVAESCTIEAVSLRSNTAKTVCGLTANGMVEITKCLFAANGGGIGAYEDVQKVVTNGISLAATATATIEGCEVRVESAGSANGILAAGNAGAATDLRLAETQIEVKAPNKANGVSCYSHVVAEDCRIYVEATGTTANGMTISLYRDTTQDITYEAFASGMYIDVRAAEKAYGISARTRIRLSDSHIATAVTGTQAYAFYLYSGEAEVTDCTAEATAGTQQAYGVYALNGCEHAVFRDCMFKADAPENGNVIRYNKNAARRLYFHGGYYSDKNRMNSYLPDSCSIYRLWDHEDEYVQGYRYTIQPIDNPDAIVACIFDEADDVSPMYRFYRITDAIEYMNAHAEEGPTVIVEGACILPGGVYEVPEGCALVVSYDDAQTRAIGPKSRRIPQKETREEHARLILSDSVTLNVRGVLEISALQKSAGTGIGGVTGSYGMLYLAPTAHINLLPGAEMQAWGCVTGDGETEVHSGASVHEGLQIGDWKGASVVYSMLNNEQGVFPISHYFYQNIESPVLYHSGANALGSAAATIMEMEVAYDDIRLIGNDKGLFMMSDDSETTLWRRYNSRNDRIEWTANGNVALNELGITFSAGIFGRFSLISSAYTLPICTNMSITAESGELKVLHDAVMLPGAEVTIGPEAKLLIPEGVSVYLYDTAQWGAYNGNSYYTVAWSPSWEVCPRDSVPVSARMTVGGTIDVQGALFATEGGALVVGTDEAEGVVRMAQKGLTGSVWQLTGSTDAYEYTESTVRSVPLRNADGLLVETERTGEYIYKEGAWSVPEEKPDDDNSGKEGLQETVAGSGARKVMDGTGCYILMPDGRKYSLLGFIVSR